MRSITTSFFAIGLLLILGSSACRGPQKSSLEDGAFTIAVIPKGTTHQYWKSIHAGAAQAAKDLGVAIIWQGPMKEDDRQMQIQVVQNFVSQGVDGIVLAPLDARSLAQPVKAATGRGLPVVIIDSRLESEDQKAYIATNNFLGGKMAAQRLNEVMAGKGKVMLMRYMEGSASTTEREAGFLEGIKEYGPGIEVVSDNQYAGATMEKALQVSQNLLNRFSNIDGIFCPNESSAQGMLRALQTAGKAGKVKFIGFDSNDALIEGLEKGEVHGLILQDPFDMGYKGVAAMVAVLKGEQIESKVDTRIMLATPENLNEKDVQSLLRPDLSGIE